MHATRQPQILFTRAASAAIVEQRNYYREKSGEDLARRWQTAVAETIRSLSTLTGRRTLLRLLDPELAGLHWLPVPRFPYRIFYLFDEAKAEVCIVHLLHDKRDIQDLLAEAIDERQQL